MFANREEAGRQLAGRLLEPPLDHPIVLGIPRGGVVVAAAIARELKAELDIALARKLRAPYRPELAIGAVDEDGSIVRNEDCIAFLEVGDDYIEQELRRQMHEIAERKALYRPVRPAVRLKGRSVIVTDDGIATGSTVIAALHSVRNQQPREIVLAIPVASPDRLREIAKLADRTVCLLAPADFNAVGMYYKDFQSVEDAEVVAILRQFARQAEGGKPRKVPIRT